MWPGRLFLIGPRGSGKSLVARVMTRYTGFESECADMDEEIVRQAGMSIREIFEQEGEAGFRRRESDVLRKVIERGSFVVATGGGVVLLQENRDLMKESGKVVWLTADVDTLWRRISADAKTARQRPNLTVGGREEVAQVVAAREPLYRAVADHVVDTTNRSPEEVAAAIYEWLQRP